MGLSVASAAGHPRGPGKTLSSRTQLSGPYRSTRGFAKKAGARTITARSESIESTKAFSDAFLDGQRGIVLVKTFNEAPDVPGKMEQHTITPDVEASGIAFLWKQFDVRGTLGGYMDIVTCAMVTVPANALIATLPTDRMPAILDPNDWAKWLGEESATVDELKAMLWTHEGVHWTMAKEAKLASRDKATVRQSIGLF